MLLCCNVVLTPTYLMKSNRYLVRAHLYLRRVMFLHTFVWHYNYPTLLFSYWLSYSFHNWLPELKIVLDSSSLQKGEGILICSTNKRIAFGLYSLSKVFNTPLSMAPKKEWIIWIHHWHSLIWCTYFLDTYTDIYHLIVNMCARRVTPCFPLATSSNTSSFGFR